MPVSMHVHLLVFRPSYLPVSRLWTQRVCLTLSAIHQIELFPFVVLTWYQGRSFRWPLKRYHSALEAIFPENFEKFNFSCLVESSWFNRGFKMASHVRRSLASPRQERGGHAYFPWYFRLDFKVDGSMIADLKLVLCTWGLYVWWARQMSSLAWFRIALFEIPGLWTMPVLELFSDINTVGPIRLSTPSDW